MRRLYNLLTSFGLGYFFGLGALALLHYFVLWPATYEQAALFALISGFGAVGTRLYNDRLAVDRDA